MEGGEMQCDQLQSLPLFTQSSLRTKYNDIHIHSNIPKYTQIYPNTLKYTQRYPKCTQIYSNALKYNDIQSCLRTKYNDIDTKEAEEGRADEAKRYMVKILPFNDKYTERLFTSSLLGDDCYLTIR